MTVARTNWAGNVVFGASGFHCPDTVAKLQQIVTGSRSLRVLGSGHSFSRIVDTAGDLVSLAGLPAVLDIDTAGSRVRVSGGIRYGELGAHLQSAGLALHNTGSLPHICVAGASSTGTHGSGNANGNLATIVSAVELITADGDLVTATRETHGEQFNGMVLALGAVGVMTSLTLDVVPTFDIRQDVYQNLSRDTLDAHFDEVMASGYSVSVFTDWKDTGQHQVWRKRLVSGAAGRAAAEPTWLGATLADVEVHPVPGMSTEAATAQLGVPGPWNQRLPHFRLDFTPSSGDELQSEYLLPRQHAAAARQALDDIADRIADRLLISEFRTVAADELWISPSYRADSVAYHFTWLPGEAAVAPVLAAIQERLAPFGARPHWGKVFSTTPEVLTGLYERLPDFQKLLIDHDPGGKFRNDFVDRLIMH